MLTRIITAVVALCVLIPVLIFASVELFWGITVLKIALAIISCIAVAEAAECIGVKKGDVLEQGEVLGLVGRTGWTTGNHLDFSVYVNGEAVDPMTYLPKK